MNRYSLMIAAIIAAAGCSGNGLTKDERNLIRESGDVMRVLVVENPEDSASLREPSADFSDKDLQSVEFRMLVSKMLGTVTDPAQDGVGIAGPQVGINRRIVAVQRFDKDGEPFEFYPNIRIESLSGGIVYGQEGCLSVPGRRGIVPRHKVIAVSWKDPVTLETVRDTVQGFSAIIFQHEIDHLEGVLYTDKADSVFVN